MYGWMDGSGGKNYKQSNISEMNENKLYLTYKDKNTS